MVPLATGLGLAIAAVPVAVGLATERLSVRDAAGAPLAFGGALLLFTFVSAFLFGAVLMPIAGPSPVLVDAFRFAPFVPQTDAAEAVR